MAPATRNPFPNLSRHLDTALRTPLSPSKQVLQIVAVQLRVWLADQTDTACRPYYIFCLELYPRGKVINQRLHHPASQKPTHKHLLSFLLDHIANPPDGERALRPTHVSFVDKDDTALLKPTLERLKMEVGTLSLPDGISEYVRLFSNKLLEMDKATRAEASERPGLLSVRSVTPRMVGDLCDAAVGMYAAKPWRKIPEHVALEIRLPSVEEEGTYRERYYVTILGSDDKAFGFALMPSLKELRTKYRRAILRKTDDDDDCNDDDDDDDDEDDDKVGKSVSNGVSKLGDDILVCGACGKRVGESAIGDEDRYVDRCGGCRRLLYCGTRCQKLDWRARHREECQRATSDPDYVFKREEWSWLNRELAMLFVDPTAIPFDDLDAVEEHGWAFVENVSPPLYPMPFVTVQAATSMSNRMERPNGKEVGSMTLIARALTECMSPPPADGILHLASGVSVLYAENLAESLHSTI